MHLTPSDTPSVSAIPSAVHSAVPSTVSSASNTAPTSPSLTGQTQSTDPSNPSLPPLPPPPPPPPKRKPATKRLRYLGADLGFSIDEIPDIEAARRAALAAQKAQWTPTGPFRFFDLPSELRSQILHHALVVPNHTLDLDPDNKKDILPQLDILQVSQRMYEEAYPIFYSGYVIRLFPIHAKFFNLKRLTVITRLPKKYRRCVTAVELRVGPGWQSPPKWEFGPLFGLKDCINLRKLRVFIEVDPSDPVFKGFRIDDTFYTKFCTRILDDVLKQVPSVQVVEFDAYPSIKKGMPLLSALLNKSEEHGKRITWGQERGWHKDAERERMEDEALARTFAAVLGF